VNALARTGLRRLEADVIPQLADAAEGLRAVDIPRGVGRSVLIPNARGLENALLERSDLQATPGRFMALSQRPAVNAQSGANS
jgi:hypothetical protein